MTAVIQYDTRDPTPYENLRRENVDYCRSRGYRYLLMIREHPVSPPWWDKLAAVATVLEEEKHDVVLFLDTDVAVMDRSLDLGEFLPAGKVFAAGAVESGDFNAGVFAVRGDDSGREFMQSWMSHYNPSAWSTDTGMWTCLGEWAGPDFEQYSLNKQMKESHGQVMHAYGPDVILHCDHFRTQDEYCVEDIQKFVDAMSVAKIVHFCGGYRGLAELRHDCRTQRIVLCRK